MNSPSVGRGHIINASRRQSEKLIIIWKLESSWFPRVRAFSHTLSSRLRPVFWQNKRFSWRRYMPETHRVFLVTTRVTSAMEKFLPRNFYLAEKGSSIRDGGTINSLERIYPRACLREHCYGEFHIIFPFGINFRASIALTAENAQSKVIRNTDCFGNR